MTDAKKAARELIAENTRRFMADDMYFSMEELVAKHLEAFAAERVREERERCAGLAGALLRSAASDYGGEDGSYALDDMAEQMENALLVVPKDQQPNEARA